MLSTTSCICCTSAEERAVSRASSIPGHARECTNQTRRILLFSSGKSVDHAETQVHNSTGAGIIKVEASPTESATAPQHEDELNAPDNYISVDRPRGTECNTSSYVRTSSTTLREGNAAMQRDLEQSDGGGFENGDGNSAVDVARADIEPQIEPI